jgi:precorrin-8X/cobalt-precorrin-8 methylmutase
MDRRRRQWHAGGTYFIVQCLSSFSVAHPSARVVDCSDRVRLAATSDTVDMSESISVSRPLFDVMVMVDWSANSAPKTGTDSIWAASLDVATGRVEVRNHPTRAQAERSIRDLLVASAHQRVLVGFDFPFGYPSGAAAVLGDERHRSSDAGPAVSTAWSRIWHHLAEQITDDHRNRNNRFAVAAHFNSLIAPDPGPFWGCPPAQSCETLNTHKRHRFPVIGSGGPIEEYRLVERQLLTQGRRPFSVWQTLYAGSVGGQALVGIPIVARLVNDPVLASRSSVWPFTTGLTGDPTGASPGAIVFAEVWPSLPQVDLTRHPIKDAAQVIGLCEWFAAADARGDLAQMFAPPLAAREASEVVGEEGWILGVHPMRPD